MNTTHQLSNRIRPGTELPAWIHEEIVKLESRLEEATSSLGASERIRRDADIYAADCILGLVHRMVSKADQQILRHTATRLLAGPGKAAPKDETAMQVMMRERDPDRGFGVSVSEMMKGEFENIGKVYLDSIKEAPAVNVDASASLVLEAVVINGITVPVSRKGGGSHG